MRWLLPIAVALMSAACQKPRPARLFGPQTPLTQADYEAVLQTWTRSQRLYEGLNNKLFVTATYHASEFRRAFAVAFPDVYGHGGDVTRRELLELSGDVEQSHTFFVVMFTPEQKWNDLDEPDSIWRLNLITSNGVTLPPSSIERVKIDANLRAVYPHMGRFDACYLVRFPLADMTQKMAIDPSTTRFTLRIASALGVAALTWDVIPAGGAIPSDTP